MNMAALHPERDGHYAEVGGQKHSTRQVCADTNEAVPLHQEVEEETLMKVLQQVV